MLYILISAVVIAADQITKYFIRRMPLDWEFSVIGEFFKIVHVENSGAAFGIMQGNTRFLLIVPAVVIVIAAVLVARSPVRGLSSFLEKLSLTLIVAGGVGNMIDRLMFGHVTDMISFSIFPPVFNVADIAVTCGCGLLMLSLFINDRNEAPK